ncbi:MAG: hypothetical protein K6U74_06900 [Firmicutes bacterium]|nr:hypothetical protein [Bacillota bacterium]
MMDHDDFDEISRLLEKCCDHCLLTRMHCIGCRIDKLRGIVGQFSKSKPFEVILMNVEDLKVLLDLARTSNHTAGQEYKVVEKWQRVLGEIAGKEIVEKPRGG